MTFRSARRLTGLALCLLLVGCAPLPGTTPLPGATRYTDDDRDLAYALRGPTSAGPLVVFENGLGNGKEVWGPVFGPTAEFARVFAYDRAGIGTSRSSSTLRDGPTIVADLRATLQGLGLEPPYLLVGHSLGGQFVELFARTYPREVAGVVFVDARPADFSARCLAEKAERCGTPWAVRPFMPAGATSELNAVKRTETAIERAPSFPPIPVRVLSARNRPASMPNLIRAWDESQQTLVALSPRARQDVCDTCGHFIQHDDPARVIRAIRELHEAAR